MGAADGFAERMRELKERSGLSYGVLAKRLHVSTSTLHRYCNGDAVPAEFAPVDRLGRLCGASREELMELHRAWILADEDRRRAKDAGAGAGSGPAAGAVAEVVPVVPVVPVGVPEPAVPAPVREPAPEPVREAEPVRETSASELAADGGTVLLGGAEPPEPPSAPAASRRRLRGALAAAAVVALAVPAAYLVGLVGGGEPSGDTKGGGTGSADANDAKPGGDAPLSVGISSYNWAAPCGQYFLLDQQPGHVPPPPPPQDTRSWARSLDGIDGGHMQLQLTVTGKTQAPVVITKLHVRMVQRQDPLDRFAYSVGDGCGSGITPQTFDIDLDAARPVVKAIAGQDGDRVVPAKDFPYKVSTGDAQVLNLDVHTEGHAAVWFLELDWSSGAKSGRIRVDDGGQPFRTSAIEGRPTYGYLPDKGQWIKYD
ncbi:helix-turn-helix domain-containing protein [Streptomyces sp. NPDC090025]|uniref:helix-turn-helix domain-containing protein n=1 Tax=Streptomyces sp. NPDC090025 TaxID=3365922 RepID=UPI0038366B15